MLPLAFADLESFAPAWSLATENERWNKRLASTMPELERFYDALLGRIPAAMEHLDLYALDDMPDDAVNLLRLVYSFVIVSFAVELWKQPTVPDTGATSFVRTGEPMP